MNSAEGTQMKGPNLTFWGISTLVIGFLVTLSPVLTGFSILILIGILLVAGGVIRMLWAFSAGSFGKGLLTLALGGLTVLCGLALIFNPLFAAAALTTVLAIYLVVDGLVEGAAALSIRPTPGWGWMMFGAVLSVLLGVMLWRQFPLSAVWAIGLLLGIRLIFAGFAMLSLKSLLTAARQA